MLSGGTAVQSITKNDVDSRENLYSNVSTSLQSGGFLPPVPVLPRQRLPGRNQVAAPSAAPRVALRECDLDGKKVQTETSSESTHFGKFFGTFFGKECTVSTRHESTGGWTVAHEQQPFDPPLLGTALGVPRGGSPRAVAIVYDSSNSSAPTNVAVSYQAVHVTLHKAYHFHGQADATGLSRFRRRLCPTLCQSMRVTLSLTPSSAWTLPATTSPSFDGDLYERGNSFVTAVERDCP